MTPLNDTVSFLAPLVPWLALVKVTALLVLLFGLSFALRRRAAATRHVLWTAGFVALATMPLLSMKIPWQVGILPAVPVSAPATAERSLVPTTPETPQTATPAETSEVGRMSPDASTPAQGPDVGSIDEAARPAAARVGGWRGGIPFRSLVLAAWLIGVLFVVLRFAIGVATLTWFGRRAEPAWCHERAAALCARLGIARPVRVLASPLLPMPITWGAFRPVILLPAESANWKIERLDAVLLHELAHVRRRDALWHTIAQLVCAVYWFHPFVWFAARRHELESEQASDAVVASSGMSPKRYAAHLVVFARERHIEAAPAALIPMVRRSQLRRRLETLLGPGRALKASPGAAVAIVLAVVVLGSFVAALRAVPVEVPSQAASSPTDSGTAVAAHPATRSSARRDPVPVASRAAESAAQIDPDKWSDREWGGSDAERRRYANNMFTRNVATFVLTDDGYTMAKWEADGSTYSAEMEGTVHISDDDSRLTSVSRDGFFVVQEVRGRDKRRYEAFPDGRGGFEEKLYESKNADHLGNADDWLARMVLLLARHTGLDAERRANRILETKGPEGVLDEIDRLTSDHVRTEYFTYLFDSGRLDKDEMREAVQKIGVSIGSDGDKTTLLIGIADNFMEDPELTRQFFETSETIASDGDRRQLISAIMERSALPQNNALVALRSIGNISSDGDKSYLLALAVERFEIDGDIAEAFFEALESVDSDGDHARVLTRMIDEGHLTEGTQRLLLRSAARISSDGDCSRVLTQFAGTNAITASTSRDFFYAADAISSDGDHRRVLTSVCRQSDPPTDVRIALLQSARRISSDGDKAEVLAEAAPLYLDDDDLREAFLEVTETISSDSDYRRVMRLVTGSDRTR